MKIFIPELPHHCNSWVVIRVATNEVIGEFRERENVEKFSPETCKVYTTIDYLCKFNGVGR